MTFADRFIQAASDFRERPWGNINYRLNETFDAVGFASLSRSLAG
jgi:hypothetical protein